jgi:hypothetical protein
MIVTKLVSALEGRLTVEDNAAVSLLNLPLCLFEFAVDLTGGVATGCVAYVGARVAAIRRGRQYSGLVQQ